MATKAPFMVIGTTPVWHRADNSYLFVAGSDIDGDGTGGRVDGDKYYQSTTTYKPNLNSKLDRFFVLAGRLIKAFPEKAIGCRGRVTLISTSARLDFVVGDDGPDDKLGEMSIKGAVDFKAINPSPTWGGTTEPLFLYEFWPDVPAVVDGKVYELQSLP